MCGLFALSLCLFSFTFSSIITFRPIYVPGFEWIQEGGRRAPSKATQIHTVMAVK